MIGFFWVLFSCLESVLCTLSWLTRSCINIILYTLAGDPLERRHSLKFRIYAALSALDPEQWVTNLLLPDAKLFESQPKF